MNLREQWNQYEDEDGDDYYEELKALIVGRSPQENVEAALGYLEQEEELELILVHLGMLAELAPSDFHKDGRVAPGVRAGETLDLDKFEEAYLEITGEFFSSAEGEQDVQRFKDELLRLPNATIEKGRLFGVTRQAVRDVFTPLFGTDVNSEELALSIRKYLELSFS